jgi:hypothetical protein
MIKRTVMLLVCLAVFLGIATVVNACFLAGTGICAYDGDSFFLVIPSGAPCGGETKLVKIIGNGFGDICVEDNGGQACSRGGSCVFDGSYQCEGVTEYTSPNSIMQGEQPSGAGCVWS